MPASPCWRVKMGQSDPRPPGPGARVQKVAPAGARGAVRYSGRFEAQTQVTLAFKVGGYVSTIVQVSRESGAPRLIQSGDVVRNGSIPSTTRPRET